MPKLRRLKETILKTIKIRIRHRFAYYVFLASTIFLAVIYGIGIGRYDVFPYKLLLSVENGYRKLIAEEELPWYYRDVSMQDSLPLLNTDQAYKGVNIVTRVANDLNLAVDIIDMDGQKLHEWNIDWFKIWPDAEHLPDRFRPWERPGTHIHGSVVIENGNLIFNFEHLGLVCLDYYGNLVWRLPYQTHHSIHRHDDGNLWVCGQKEHEEYTKRFPNRLPPYAEYMILEITPEGKIVEEWSVAEILKENGFSGLLFLGSTVNWSTDVRTDDLLHLNDVEPFPDTMKEDFFKRGDVLVSLRNINTIFVFNRYDRKVKFICTGWFVRQHDPDFIDGNRFSVFDNNLIAATIDLNQQSRIAIVSARQKAWEIYFEGNAKIPFYTNIMGKSQWLPNGNLLITESKGGRAFEINRQGEVVWEYINYVDRGIVGLVEQVQRLSPEWYRNMMSNIESSED